MRSKRAIMVLAMSALALGVALAPASAAAAPKSADKAEAKTPKVKGSIKIEGHPSLDDLKKRVKIAQADAEKTAIKAVGAKEPAKVTYSELEIEQGYLIYSIDVKVTGKDGIEEVWIDPGTGKVLAKMHESDDDEDSEAAEDEDDD